MRSLFEIIDQRDKYKEVLEAMIRDGIEQCGSIVKCRYCGRYGRDENPIEHAEICTLAKAMVLSV